jgi:hypothetical protein
MCQVSLWECGGVTFPKQIGAPFFCFLVVAQGPTKMYEAISREIIDRFC